MSLVPGPLRDRLILSYSSMKTPFHTIPEVIADIRKGRMVIVTDDADRENEGDLVMAASKVTATAVNFMAKHGRGLICAPVTEERAQKLGLQRMVAHNREMYATDFTVSVDAAKGITTGISANDRAATIRVLVNADSRPADLVQPGHVFPLQARTEASCAVPGTRKPRSISPAWPDRIPLPSSVKSSTRTVRWPACHSCSNLGKNTD